MFNTENEEIYRIHLDFGYEISSFFEIKLLVGENKVYLSLSGNPADLEFLIFVKNYCSMFKEG
jgi:hypothetical protein